MSVHNKCLYRYLDTDGDGTGTKNAVGNYSGAVEEFKIVPAAGETFYLSRIMVSVTDAGSFDSGSYGNNITLTNGISLKLKNTGDPTIDITDGVPIITNSDWCRLAGPDVSVMSWGSGDEQMVVRFTFTKAGQALKLSGDDGASFCVELNDDFSNLVSQYFMVQGSYL